MSVIKRFAQEMAQDCPQPVMLRVLVHPVTKQLVLIGGEFHKYFEKIGKAREERTVYFRILSEIARKTLLTKDENSPFRKVLLLSEKTPDSDKIELYGGKLDPTLFQEIYESPLLIEASLQMQKLAKRYPSNFLYRGTDFRHIFDAEEFTLYYVYGRENTKHKKPNDAYMESLVRVLFAVIVQDYDLEKYNDWKAEAETNAFLEKIESSEKKASKTFKATKDELEGLRKYFIQFVKSITEEDATGSIIFKQPSDKDFLKVYRPLFFSLNFLMDIYTMNFILRMPSKTLTVFFGGLFHAERIFNLLCSVHGFKLFETELTFKPVVGPCAIVFPDSSPSTIALIDKYNEKTKEVYEKYIQQTEKNKKRFMINMIAYRDEDRAFISLPITEFTTYHQNLTLSYFGLFAHFISDSTNQEKLFTTFIPWSLEK